MRCGLVKVKKVVHWSPPLLCVLKFDVDGTVRGKPGLVGIDGVLCNSKGEVLYMFLKLVGFCDSNVADVLAILEAF